MSKNKQKDDRAARLLNIKKSEAILRAERNALTRGKK